MVTVEDKEDEEEKQLDIELSGTVTFVVNILCNIITCYILQDNGLLGDKLTF